MLSNFIRRNGKRRNNKANESQARGHQQSSSTSSSVESPLVFDIKEESRSLSVTQTSPLVELNFSDSNEGWFPQELLQRSCSPGSSSTSHTKNDAVTENNLVEVDSHLSPQGSPCHSRNVSAGISFRGKLIPAPILIPGAEALMPNVQIGHSVVPTGGSCHEAPQPNLEAGVSNLSSPPVSEDLSSISGTTLARALIASSFVLSSSEYHTSRRRSGVERQDSATLPRGDALFLSDLGSSSPIPPMPPVPEKMTGDPLNYPSTVSSGASTESEYPTSGSCLTSSEMVTVAINPRRVFRIHETPSPIASASAKTSPSVTPDTAPQLNAKVASTCTQTIKNGVFDGPKTAVEAPLPIDTQERAQQRGTLFLLNSDGHSIDEFDFVPPGTAMATVSPGLDSSASYIAPLPKRSGTIRGQLKRRIGESDLVRNTSKDSEGCLTPSGTVSEHDYGELLHYDLAVGPGSSPSSNGPSSASAGYQTFPETPVVFSPFGSPGYTFAAKSDSQLHKKLPSPKQPRSGLAKLYSSMRSVRRQMVINGDVGGPVALRRSQSSSLPKRNPPPSKHAQSSLSPLVQENDEPDNPDETMRSPATSPVEALNPSEDRGTVRHPLAHISSSSSCLPVEEALQALAQRSSSSLPSILMGDGDSSPTTMMPVIDSSIELPASVPLPESTYGSHSSSPVSTRSVSRLSPFNSPFHSSFHSLATPISHSSKSPLPAPSSYPEGLSFLPSPQSSTSSNESHSRSTSPVPIVTRASEQLTSHLPSFAPPPYHTVVSERTSDHLNPSSSPPLPELASVDPGYHRGRRVSNSLVSGSTRPHTRARPPLPIGPRRPSGPGHVPGVFIPEVHARNGSTSSVGGSTDSPGSLWRKLQFTASKPPPKFQTPPPKWRGLTLEAAHWTFTSAQLQEIVSHAIQQSSEGSSLRLLKLETLEGEVADEVIRLELQHTDVKAQYKTLVRRRWILMGALASHLEGAEINDASMASRTVEELTEVSVELDNLAEKAHEIVLRLAQLKSLREVHNASALAMVMRKINGLLVRQMAEKERLRERVEALGVERDDAWKHAVNAAQDYDMLNDRVSDAVARRDVEGDAPAPADAQSVTSSKRSTRILAVRKSSIRLSQASLRSRSKLRARRSSTSAPRPASLTLIDVPPIPSLPVNTSLPTGSGIDTGVSPSSVYSNETEAEAWELEEAQREVYGMLGLSVPPSQASSRRRTMSSTDDPKLPLLSSRPVSESLDTRVRHREDWGKATKAQSVVLDDHYPVVGPLNIARRGRIATPLG